MAPARAHSQAQAWLALSRQLAASDTIGELGLGAGADAGSTRADSSVASRTDHGGRGPDAASCSPRIRSPPITLSASGRRHG